MRNRKGRVLYFDERATRWNPMKWEEWTEKHE
jgi:hypothetical protein